jgi:hypothetical protein
MKKQLTGKLLIHRETLSTLSPRSGLDRVGAAATTDTGSRLCPSHYFACLASVMTDSYCNC